MNRSDTLPKMEDLVARRIYKIKCRNLSYGMWNGKDGFVGIRYKFGDRFLFTEFHWDTGEPYGTVWDAEDTGVDLPEGISMETSLGARDHATGRRVVYDKKDMIWRDAVTNQRVPQALPSTIHNVALFDFLDQFKDEDE